MKNFLLVAIFLIVLSCTTKSELDNILEKDSHLKTFVDSLKTTSLIYKNCTNCNLSGLEENKIIGFTDRYPPKGNYYKKEIDIGLFEYDSYLIYDSENDERTNGKLYICYFNQQQKELFNNFLPFYSNHIAHYKQLLKIIQVNNTIIISIEYQG